MRPNFRGDCFHGLTVIPLMDCGITTEAPSPGMVTPPVDVDLHSQTMDDREIREDSHGGHAERPERRDTSEEAKSTGGELEGPTTEKCISSGKSKNCSKFT